MGCCGSSDKDALAKLQKLQTELDSSQTRIKVLEAENSQLKTKIKSLTSDYETLRKEHSECLLKKSIKLKVRAFSSSKESIVEVSNIQVVPPVAKIESTPAPLKSKETSLVQLTGGNLEFANEDEELKRYINGLTSDELKSISFRSLKLLRELPPRKVIQLVGQDSEIKKLVSPTKGSLKNYQFLIPGWR